MNLKQDHARLLYNLQQLQKLMQVSYDGLEKDIRDVVAEIIPTYHPAGEHGSCEKGTAYEQQLAVIKNN